MTSSWLIATLPVPIFQDKWLSSAARAGNKHEEAAMIAAKTDSITESKTESKVPKLIPELIPELTNLHISRVLAAFQPRYIKLIVDVSAI